MNAPLGHLDEILDRSVAAVQGTPAATIRGVPNDRETGPSHAVAQEPLWFDGGVWSRRPMKPGADRNLHGVRWPQHPPVRGWWVWTLNHQGRNGGDLGGVVIDVDELPDDPETGELGHVELVVAASVYATKSRVVQLAGGVTDVREFDTLEDVRRLPLAWTGDIGSATPSTRTVLQGAYDDVQSVLNFRRNRARHGDHHVEWLRHARHALEGLLA